MELFWNIYMTWHLAEIVLLRTDEPIVGRLIDWIDMGSSGTLYMYSLNDHSLQRHGAVTRTSIRHTQAYCTSHARAILACSDKVKPFW
jgi:hypothetical protein